MKVKRRHHALCLVRQVTPLFEPKAPERWPARVIDIGGKLLRDIVISEEFSPGYTVRLDVTVTSSVGKRYRFPLTSQGF